MTDPNPKARGVVKIELRKMVPTDDGRGKVSRRIGTRSGIVELEVDLEALLAILGPRALANRGRVAKLQEGAITARVLELERDRRQNLTALLAGCLARPLERDQQRRESPAEIVEDAVWYLRRVEAAVEALGQQERADLARRIVREEFPQ